MSAWSARCGAIVARALRAHHGLGVLGASGGAGMTKAAIAVPATSTTTTRAIAMLTHSQAWGAGLRSAVGSKLNVAGKQGARRGFYSVTNARRRLIPRLSPDNAVYGLIGLNVAVYAGWFVATASADGEGGSSYMMRFMSDHFLCSYHALVKEWRLHTLLTSCFTHTSGLSLLTSSLALYFIGGTMASVYGGPAFVATYVASGIASNLVWVSQHGGSWWASRRPHTGSDAAVNGCVTLYIATFPTSTIYLYFLIPVPAAALGAVFLLRDFVGLQGDVGQAESMANLGGTAAGGLMWFMITRGIFRM